MTLRLGTGCAILCALLLTRCGSSGTLSESEADPTIVALLGDEVLRAEDFRLEYQRNAASAPAGERDTPEVFLDRYIDYRLKVRAAEDAGYSEDPIILDEIHSYRAAFARPYLVDRRVLAPILLDYYEKKKQFVHASQVFFQAPIDSSPRDTLRAYVRAHAIRDSVMAGMPFAEAAVRFSEDPAASTQGARQGYRGDLGWFTAGMMIKPFEDQAYSAPLGEVSEVFRTEYGYHFILVHGRRPAIPSIRLSQILIRIPHSAPESVAVAREKIDRAKGRLNAGQNFSLVAGDMSEEMRSRQLGGDIGMISYFSRGIDTTFKRLAFGIPEVGDVTDVIRTGYGFQILKLTHRDTLDTYEAEFERLKREASGLPRMIKAEEALAQDARNRYAASLDSTALTSLVKDVGVDSVRVYFGIIASHDSLGKAVIGHVADTAYTVAHLGRFAQDRNNRIMNAATAEEQALIIGEAFLDYAAITHRALDLEHEDEEFAWIMRNFRDGLLLFRLMEDSVWAAAADDSLGLVHYYEANKEQFWFGDRHRLIEVFGYDAEAHEEAILKLDGGMSWPDFYEDISQDSVRLIRTDTVLVEGPTRSVYDRALNLKPGEHTEVTTFRNGFITLFYDALEPARQQTFDEARGEVTSGYQAKLEAELLARLRAQYQVTTFPERAREALADL